MKGRNSTFKDLDALTTSLEGRPILSIDLIRVSPENLVACIGDTAGAVSLWILPGMITIDREFIYPLPVGPLNKLQCHQMGANCVALKNIKCFKVNGDAITEKFHLILASGGDDQGVSCSIIEIEICKSDASNRVFNFIGGVLARESSASAIKGIKIIDRSAGVLNIYTVGYDQRLTLWSVDLPTLSRSSKTSLKFLSSAPVDIFDVNCLDTCLLIENELSIEYLVVGGQGLELFSFDPNPLLAAQALKKSNYLLVTCGAGKSNGETRYSISPS